MAFDGITVACMAHELNKNLAGGRISKIAQPETDELLLTVKSQEGNFRLLLSASASLPLVYLTQNNKPSPLTAPNFCMLLPQTHQRWPHHFRYPAVSGTCTPF